jgi:hypothetical protein
MNSATDQGLKKNTRSGSAIPEKCVLVVSVAGSRRGTARRTTVMMEARMRRRVERLLFTLEKSRRPHTAHDQIKMSRKRPTPTPETVFLNI